LNTLRHFGRFVFVLLAVWVWGCSENNTTAPPPSPPQIGLERITGMVNDDTYDVFVDSQNRLWVSTENGIYMFPTPQGPFDLKNATQFTDRDGIPNLRCRGVNELNGKVYVATWGGGFGIYNNATPWEAVEPVDTLLTGRVYEMAPDDTSMWLATVERVTQYLDNGATSIRDRLVDWGKAFGDRKFSSIVVLTAVGGKADSGEVWVSQEVGDSIGIPLPGGIKVLGLPDGMVQFFRPESSGIPSDDVGEVVWDPTRGVIWSTHLGEGVATVDLAAKKWRTYTMADGIVSDLASSVAVNHLGSKWPTGTVWIATQAGVTKMAPDGSMVNYGNGSGLPTIHVRKVVVDRNDDVWLCFVGDGAAKIVPPAR
jgi:ligand-binding sensor domain-containing protein